MRRIVLFLSLVFIFFGSWAFAEQTECRTQTHHDPMRLVCEDQRARALRFAGEGSVPANMNLPYTVHVSSDFPDPNAILAGVMFAARTIERGVGFTVLKAGKIRDDLPRVGADGATHSHWVPPLGEIHVLCCSQPPYSGTASIGWRLITLTAHTGMALHVLDHEIWHLFGFSHDDQGVKMSNRLRGNEPSWHWEVSPTHQDHMNLACALGLEEEVEQ